MVEIKTRANAEGGEMIITRAVANFALFLLVAIFLAAVLMEWAVGCGEPIYRADGTWQTAECIFIDNEIKTGTWK